jgi:hypothetical protein
VFTVLTALSGMEREYIRDPTLKGHESARKRGKTIGGAGVTDADMLSMTLHPREQEMSHAPRHHHGQEGTAPLARDRHADAARSRRVARTSPTGRLPK